MPTPIFSAALCLTSTLTFALPTLAAAPSEVASCLACHGAQGEGMPAAGYPRLAGLPKAYISAQLNAYQNSRRVNPIMSGIAQPLSAAQIEAIANWFSTLPIPNHTGTPITDSQQAIMGQRLAERGDWNAGIPACFNCHSSTASGVGAHFPPIIGQPASYIEAQIQAWKQGLRQAAPDDMANTLMYAVALRMNDAQVKSVAAWLAAHPTGNTSPSASTSIKP